MESRFVPSGRAYRHVFCGHTGARVPCVNLQSTRKQLGDYILADLISSLRVWVFFSSFLVSRSKIGGEKTKNKHEKDIWIDLVEIVASVAR